MSNTIYSGYSSAWKPSGYDIARKYRSFLTYDIEETDTSFTVKVSAGVSLNATITASYSCYLKVTGQTKTTKTGSTVLRGDKKVTIISTKTYTFSKRYEEQTITLEAGVSSSTGAWSGVVQAVATQLVIPALGLYTVSFDTGGVCPPPSSQVLLYGFPAVEPVLPAITGYKFIEWCVGSDHGTPFDFNTLITESIILYAKWEHVPVYVNIDGEWMVGKLYAKVNGEWRDSNDVYVKVDEAWIKI